MKLRITDPTAILVDTDVRSVRAEDASGSFGILSGHADFLTALGVSIVSWRGLDGAPGYCAVRNGILTVSHGTAGDPPYGRGPAGWWPGAWSVTADKPEQPIVEAIRTRAERRRLAQRLPSVARNLGQIGVLGWQIVLPALVGLAIGRWLDHRLDSGIFWTAPLLLVGLALGCWSGWRWMHRQ